jgi:hypothetical protein
MTDLNQQQQALLEQYHCAHATWQAVRFEDDVELGTAYAAALDACLDAGVDPFHHPAP